MLGQHCESARGCIIGARRGRKTEKDGDRHEKLERKMRQESSDNMNTMLCV